jgi:hypothetical protein
LQGGGGGPYGDSSGGKAYGKGKKGDGKGKGGLQKGRGKGDGKWGNIAHSNTQQVATGISLKPVSREERGKRVERRKSRVEKYIYDGY